jgi:hypothetical protein
MLFKAKVNQGPAPLKPFVLRLRDSFLVGLGMDPDRGSPCIHCTERWLTQRRVWTEPMKVSELTLRRDLLTDLLEENSAHTLYEISMDGTASRLDCIVFPHPDCECRKNSECYVPRLQVMKKINFAFSPITQLKCARYGTPNGNLWLTTAAGNSPLSEKMTRTFAVAREREASRMRAVEEWMKRAAFSDLGFRLNSGEEFLSQDLRSGKLEAVLEVGTQPSLGEGLGAGSTPEEAELDALFSLVKARTVRKYSTTMKHPMLVVGAHNWLRGRIPFFLMEQYDLHLLFYPNSTPAWVVGVAAFSRKKTNELPIFLFGADAEITKALDSAIFKMLEHCRPADWKQDDPSSETGLAHASKLNLWWTHWIYRCPKIALKDVLHLEAYPREVSAWRGYFADGQERLTLLPVNHSLLPDKVRHLVKLSGPSLVSPYPGRNVNGIGTWASFQNALS